MNINVNKLALAIGITFTALAATPSYALLISTTVKASTSDSENGITTTDTDGPANSATSAQRGSLVLAKGDNTGYSKLYTGGFLSDERNSLSPLFTLHAQASVLHSAVITNDTGVDQKVNFKYLILAGNITVGSNYDYQSSFSNSGYSADIRVNGISLWGSNAQIDLNSSGRTLTQGGTSLQGSLLYNDSTYVWDNFNGSLSLGYLAAGASLTLDYQLSTYVNQFLVDAGYADPPAAMISDPFDFSTNPLFAADNFTATPAIPVDPTELPEPASTLLLGAGLAALAFRRRKARTTNV